MISCQDLLEKGDLPTELTKMILTAAKGYNSFDFKDDYFIEEYSFPVWRSDNITSQLIQLEVPQTNISDYGFDEKWKGQKIGYKKRFAFKVSGKKALVEKNCTVRKTFDFIGENFQVTLSSVNVSERFDLFRISTLDGEY